MNKPIAIPQSIPYGRQEINAADIDAVVAILRSDRLTQGQAMPRFEEALAARCGARHAVAVSSGTAALHVACAAFGLGPGDVLWTSPNTFAASANCALSCGASIDLVDIEVDTGNMSVDALADKLERAERSGSLPKVVVPVHFGGHPCDMRPIKALSERYGFRILEDAAHALGATYFGEPIGNCRYSDAAVFSFHAIKAITTGEGGAVVTNDPELAARMARLRAHGAMRDPARMQERCDDGWYYEIAELGWNYRMTDLQAALGSSQLQRLDRFLERRTALAARYGQLLAQSGLKLPQSQPGVVPAWHLYAVGWNESVFGISRSKAFARLREVGIGVQVHYIPLHFQPLYQKYGFRRGQFPNAETRYRDSITIPLFASMSDEQQDYVVWEITRLAA